MHGCRAALPPKSGLAAAVSGAAIVTNRAIINTNRTRTFMLRLLKLLLDAVARELNRASTGLNAGDALFRPCAGVVLTPRSCYTVAFRSLALRVAGYRQGQIARLQCAMGAQMKKFDFSEKSNFSAAFAPRRSDSLAHLAHSC
jgi:hypothetical protein